ncbi:DUF2953 domain-containing protein [Romboutsia maritimum]|uniref:DUF2953 domain-containing protein n=2 Tax=Romboutsia maritimum TaxID=2020948 RepID=A0A371IWB9_9FIRM|nr:DUF2953 domain-containing protein [Romboutsia maritimum]
MRYNEIFKIPIGVLLFMFLSIILIVLFCKIALNIIITIDVNNEDISIKLNIKYIMGLINIKKQIYPKKSEKQKTKKKGENKSKRKIRLLKTDLAIIYKLTENLRVYEFYSNIEIGSTCMKFTSFICLVINIIYGNLANIITAKKIYLGFKPDFTNSYIITHIKIHMKPTIKDLIYLGIVMYKIYIKNYKKGDNNESDRVNSKSYGNNS